MPPYPNLISESLLVMETIDYLVSVGGSASASRIVEYVMSIKNANEAFARVLAADIVGRDSRLSLNGDTVELFETDHDTIDLENTSFVVFDLETTGAKAPPCRITEIGAYRVENGAVAGEFHTLVNPEMPIPEFIQWLTGISDDMVRDAPKFGDVSDEFLRFIGDSVLVAHNAPFDLGFLNHEVGKVHEDYRVGNPSLCTVQLSRRLLPDIENHKLKTVANYYSVDLINHHRAGEDAHATARIFINLLKQMNEMGIRDLGAARKFSQRKHYVRQRKAAA
jgi:DNA polymerase III epsilon subunit family exonuclease